MHPILFALFFVASALASDQDDSVVVDSIKQSPNSYFLSPHYPADGREQSFFRFWYSTTTVLASTTSTSTVTCTVSTTACTGRRRRFALEENAKIEPSSVEPVETTAMVESIREERKADPQYMLMKPVGLPGYNQLYEIDPTYTAMPYQAYYYPFNPYQLMIGQRSWFGLSSLFIRTTTRTSTFFTVFTSTSTPACSAVGTIAQCPTSG